MIRRSILTAAVFLVIVLVPQTASATYVGNPVAQKNGGTGNSSYTDGQLLIGSTSTGGLTKSTLTQGSGITITNAGGSITIAATAGTAVQEVPNGTCNGSTTAFTLANTPTASATVSLYLDGLNLTQGSGKDYTISGSSITLASACATGQSLYAVYSK